MGTEPTQTADRIERWLEALSNLSMPAALVLCTGIVVVGLVVCRLFRI